MFDAIRAGQERHEEKLLRSSLERKREGIRAYRADTGEYPTSLDALVDTYYLKAVPADPITGSSETWIVEFERGSPRVVEVRSGAPGESICGETYFEW